MFWSFDISLRKSDNSFLHNFFSWLKRVSQCLLFDCNNNNFIYQMKRHYVRRGVVLHSTKPRLRFCASSNPARGALKIRDYKDLWQWSRLEIRQIAFCWSTIPQKQFIIIFITGLIRKRKFFKKCILWKEMFEMPWAFTNYIL